MATEEERRRRKAPDAMRRWRSTREAQRVSGKSNKRVCASTEQCAHGWSLQSCFDPRQLTEALWCGRDAKIAIRSSRVRRVCALVRRREFVLELACGLHPATLCSIVDEVGRRDSAARPNAIRNRAAENHEKEVAKRESRRSFPKDTHSPKHTDHELTTAVVINANSALQRTLSRV